MMSDVECCMTHFLYFSDTKPYSIKQVLYSKMHLFCLITDNGHSPDSYLPNTLCCPSRLNDPINALSVRR